MGWCFCQGTSQTLSQFQLGGCRNCALFQTWATSRNLLELAAEGLMPEQPLCQEGIPRFMLPTSPLLHTHAFRFYI